MRTDTSQPPAEQNPQFSEQPAINLEALVPSLPRQDTRQGTDHDDQPELEGRLDEVVHWSAMSWGVSVTLAITATLLVRTLMATCEWSSFFACHEGGAKGSARLTATWLRRAGPDRSATERC